MRPMDFEDELGEEVPEKVANGKMDKAKKKKEKRREKQKGKEKEKTGNESDPGVREDCDLEEVDFWMPAVGNRWDFDDGGDRWGSDAESEPRTAEEATGLYDKLLHVKFRMMAQCRNSSHPKQRKKKEVLMANIEKLRFE